MGFRCGIWPRSAAAAAPPRLKPKVASSAFIRSVVARSKADHVLAVAAQLRLRISEPRHVEALVELEAGLIAFRPDDRSEHRSGFAEVEIGLGAGRKLERGFDHRAVGRDVA